MSCVREGSLEPPYQPHADHVRHGEGRTGRFLRGLRRMFKRRGSGQRTAPDASPDNKSRSTSELLDADKHARRKEGAYSSGLSVSHDSVFTGERSGDESSDERQQPAQKHLPSSHRAELVAAVRRRGRGDASDDDEDLGLPRSPPASPPTDKADKRHHAGISQSSCSDGSLLSVGSSEMDEDSSSGAHSHEHHNDSYNSSEPPSGVAPLSHSAAKHKMAVRPRRTHGAPRRKKNTQIAASALPITPELNEEIIRSATPDVSHKSTEVVSESFSSSTTTKHQVIVRDHHHQLNKELQRVLEVPEETKTKSSSLPPGLALSQLMGQSPAKLSIAELDTPRSSIKRSKSSSQGRSLRDESPKPTHVSISESQINSYHSEERIISRSEKYTEECLNEKKTKSDKKVENEGRSNKKEESFFSRLLLRKSGKKSKKEQTEPDGQQDSKKSKTEKIVTPQYKPVESECSYGLSQKEFGQNHHRSTDKNALKTAGQRAFANQMHKRLDNKGVYVQEGLYKDHNTSKVYKTEYTTDLKLKDEISKISDIKNSGGRRENFMEKPNRTSSKEAIDEVFNQERPKRQSSKVQQSVDQFSSKAFVNNELTSLTNETAVSPTLVISEEEISSRTPRYRGLHNNDYAFHSGSMPKSIPYFNHNLNVSASASPPKSLLRRSTENVKPFNRSSEFVSEYSRERQSIETFKRNDSVQHNFNFGVSKNDPVDSYAAGLRSLGDEYIETRSSIGKSHSFRYASETPSLSSQENQMPSLPAIVGISEPLLESWEVNYRRTVSHNHDYKRLSARNYNLLHSNAEMNYDSLPSTDSSYLDSLKTESQPDVERKPLYTNSILITESNKRDSDISQIEAKIDDIISSPKPIIGVIIKSSSLDSVKSTPEKTMDERRKTISVESALSQSSKTNNAISQTTPATNKQDPDNFITVTVLNKDSNALSAKSADSAKINKSEEAVHKSNDNIKTGVPEFLKIQLNKVDSKPESNVVLTVTPKKTDSPPVQDNKDHPFAKSHEIKIINNTLQHQTPIRKSEHIQATQKTVENVTEAKQSVDTAISVGKITPIINRKSALPQSPSSTPKAFFKRKAISVDLQEKSEKARTSSLSTEGSTEKVFDNISMDQKSHSSFGSKSSIQSTDSNDVKLDEGVTFRKKPVMIAKDRNDKKNDDEPELMKVFARRSLKLKDSEAETLAQEIAEANNIKDEAADNVSATRAKILKNEFNASIKSRDSDKENEEIILRGHSAENKYVDIAARVSQFGVPHYQRSVSISSVSSSASNPKRESAPPYNRSEVSKYKKEVSDSTPEKRLRNRTFPDPSNDREDIKSITSKNDALPYKVDTLSKRLWSQHKKEEDKKSPLKNMSLDIKEKTQGKSDSAVIEKDSEIQKDAGEKEKGIGEGEADASPQFKGILQMRAEWERRAMQGMTK